MTDKLENKIIEVLDLSIEGAKAASGKLAQIAEQYGPQAVDTVLYIVRLNNAGKLFEGVLWVGVAYALFRVSRWCAEKAEGADDPIYSLGGLFCGVGTLISVWVALFNLANFWNWVGLFAPELWLARKVFEKVVG